ncbi:MAG: hypothetical protein EBT83_06110 [Betaproteobacteria bacterium]|nr:hypothetical protein [Betaproteobacteria bacterium]
MIMNKGPIIALLAACIACGIYWNYRSVQSANEARLLEERTRATKMEAEIDRLKAELSAREDNARLRMIEQQQNAASAQQARLERQLIEVQRQAADMLARRQAAESEADARQRAARDAQTIQALENERLNARRQQEQEALRQQLQQAQQDALRRQQQQYEDQRRRAQQGY